VCLKPQETISIEVRNGKYEIFIGKYDEADSLAWS